MPSLWWQKRAKSCRTRVPAITSPSFADDGDAGSRCESPPGFRLPGDAQIGQVLRNRAEDGVELARLLHVVVHVGFGGAILQQRRVAVDDTHRIYLDVG